MRKAVERGEARRRPIPAQLITALPPWEDLLAWTAAAHRLVAQGYSGVEIARSLGKSQATVQQRLWRHPPDQGNAK